MTLHYEFLTKSYYNKYLGEWDEESEEFEYEIDFEDEKKALVDILYETHISFYCGFMKEQENRIKKAIDLICHDFDDWERLEEIYEEELHKYFEEEAKEQFENQY